MAIITTLQCPLPDFISDSDIRRGKNIAGFLGKTRRALGSTILYVLLHSRDVKLALAGSGHPHGLLGNSLGSASIGSVIGSCATARYTAITHAITSGSSATIHTCGVGAHKAPKRISTKVGPRRVHVHAHDMTANGAIELLVTDVADQKDKIETTQNGGHEINVLTSRLEVIISTKHGVGRGKDTRSTIKYGGNASLGHRDGLLFHRLVNGDSIRGPHLIELIYADNAAIC
mmetsp:Transcript_17720/g.39279  ORF Transcript_17720/g.39279 Transcript_17720/m.39279 type:complete len:231 (+) Transcript_17720:1575-2267(+)